MKTSQAVVMVTRRCNMSCAHCSVESHPKLKKQPDEAELRSLVDRLLEARVRTIQFTGGEPMLRADLVVELMQQAKAKGVPSTMVSNGFWGKKKDRARVILKQLLDSGLTRLALSYDRFHSEFQGPEPLLNILEVVKEIDWTVHINITRSLDDKDLDRIVEPFRNHPHAQLRFYDIQPVGLAKNLQEELRSQLDGFCSACEQATFTDNGRVIACNGPAYFEKSSSPLVVGEHRSGKTSVEDLLKAHAEDPILETIRVDGPSALKEVLQTLPGFENHPFKSHYSGMCELCLELNSQPKVVKALRAHLSEPAVAAQRLARKLVLQAAKRQSHHRHAINLQKAPEAFLNLLIGRAESAALTEFQDVRKVFGRADLDWAHQARLLKDAGLLHLLEEHQDNPLLSAWAPHFFWSQVKEEQQSFTVRSQVSLHMIEEILAAARDLGIELRPWGATRLLIDGNPRLAKKLEFATSHSVEPTRKALEQRLGYGIQLHPETKSELDITARTALEVTSSWWHHRFCGGLQTGWDLHYLSLQTDNFEHKLSKVCCERKLGRAWQHLASQLDFASTSPSNSRRTELCSKIVRYQMYLERSARTNFLLEAVIPLLFCDQWTDAAKRGSESLSRFTHALRELWETNDPRSFLKTIGNDTRQALIAAGLLQERRIFIKSEAIGERGNP